MCDERQTCQAKDQETAREHCPVIQTELQQVRIASPDRLKAPLEALMNAREDAISLFLFRMLAPGGLPLSLADFLYYRLAGA